jgi:hypothetical protein
LAIATNNDILSNNSRSYVSPEDLTFDGNRANQTSGDGGVVWNNFANSLIQNVALRTPSAGRCEYIAVQQQAAQIEQALREARQAVEQQKGRMQGALEAILDRRDLDAANHSWDFDGKTVTLRAVT